MSTNSRTLLVFAVLALVMPVLLWLAFNLGGLLDVLRTGQCPPAPPDIPAYACTPVEYLARMLFGPFALIGNLTLCCGSWALLALVGGLVLAVRKPAAQ